MTTLCHLSDSTYEKAVIKNAFPRNRDDDEWQRLQSPGLIRRTRATLLQVLERHLAAVQARNADWLQLDRHGQFSSHDDYLDAQSAFKRQHRRDANFTAVMHVAITEVNTALKQVNREASESLDRQNLLAYRAAIGELVHAIMRHREQRTQADDVDEVDDQLWETLENVLAPNGDGWVSVREFESIRDKAEERNR